MKLKQTPDDFQVTELTAVSPSAGPFALYELEKRGWTTPDALASVRSRWKIDFRRLSYGGLKDRHAFTRQHFTIFRGPQKGLVHHDVSVRYLGQINRPFTSADIEANQFQITLRKLSETAAAAATARASEVARFGVPNYFDDQRFGSTDGEEFAARLMVLGRYEDALRLALAGDYVHDKSAVKREKATLLKHWSNWAECKSALERGHARSIVDYLVHHPTDFKGAVARLRPELQGLYLSAYQSFLWNRMLAAFVSAVVPADRTMMLKLKLARVPAASFLSETELGQLSCELPLPSARLKLEPDSPWHPIIEAALADQGFSLSAMKLPGLREPFFSKGSRPAWVMPARFSAEPGADELHAGYSRLRLGFELPRGSYATIVVKRLTQSVPDS
ncbi:MAG: tRNA pseudouridine(13) synthase TruD [Gemmataceae bacterium]|nr:tRNA pseudouridine(13) synthase TruD [Gemmataceae bacterium]